MDAATETPSTSHDIKYVHGKEYQYTPIEWDQVRLVVLEPGFSSHPICCRIETFCRSDAPSYEAVSYTWGDDALNSTIHILNFTANAQPQSTTLSVPQTCASVLRGLRYPTRPRKLWIDTLCINQFDIPERSSQVRAMPQIYRSASQVVVCLSNSPDSEDEQHIPAMEYISDGRFKHTSPEMKATVKRLFQHPWFARIWVIQEVAKARYATVFCAGRYAPWSNFALCASRLGLDVPVLSPIRRLRDRGWINVITTEQFVKAICETTACKCRDDKDRVFAFLSMYPTMMNKAQIEVFRISGSVHESRRRRGTRSLDRKNATTRRDSEFEPLPYGSMDDSDVDDEYDENTPSRLTDYASSLEAIYTQYATLFLKNLGLDFLSSMQGRSQPDTLPSWVPDWRVKKNRTILAHLPLTGFNAGGHAENQSFHISPATDDHSRQMLEVNAIYVDNVKILGDPCDISQSSWEDVVFRRWRYLAGDAKLPLDLNNDKTKVLYAFLGTLMADPDGEFRYAYHTLAERLLGCDDNEKLGVTEGLDPDVIERLKAGCHGRRLFIAEDGTMGLVASESQERDMIAVLPGARVLYSFRSRNSSRVGEVALIGEAFVLGMMNGQALSGTSCGPVKEIYIS